jgi:lipoate-protein ligase A
MSELWRRIDTGLQSPARNVALSQALLESRNADEIPSTLRFARSTPCVLVGYAETPEGLVDTSFCRDNDIAVVRSISYGPAAYVDEQQLLCELFVHRREVTPDDVRVVAKRVAHAGATALCALGVEAHQRDGKEIEVDGRTIASIRSGIDGNAILVQTWLSLQSASQAIDALCIVRGELRSAAVAAARARTISVADALGSRAPVSEIEHYIMEAFESTFDAEFREGELTLTEEARCKRALRAAESALPLSGLLQAQESLRVVFGGAECKGGRLQALVVYDVRNQSIRHIWFSQHNPQASRTIFALETRLRGAALAQLPDRVSRFFSSHPRSACIPEPDEIVAVIHSAIDQRVIARNS